ncbi:YlaI family protein [Bhargavaea cecembensis]|uniref:YlaI family protein n=1 Tax=Bhargavaea cecembensis TaxID=394098 RepID=UPI00058FC103|nr:YlaI family protein [Bhargavaea cecembensis]
MLVKCVLCDREGEISDDAPEAKRLRNRPIHTYMCPECHDRISSRTAERIATGKFCFRRTSASAEERF